MRGWGLLVLIRVEVFEVDVVFETGFEAGEEVGPARALVEGADDAGAVVAPAGFADVDGCALAV